MNRFAHIAATGRYVPGRVVTNGEIEHRIGQRVDQWLVENVGIHQRHFMADDERPSGMAVAAARQALDRAGLTGSDLDLIIVATDTPDVLSPATATIVQHQLGAINAGAYDLNTACASWVTALDVAAKTIVADAQYRRVLVVGTYGMSRFIDWSDKKTCTIFADGAAAAIVSEGGEPGIIRTKLKTFGELHQALGIFGGGAVAPTERPYVRFAQRTPPAFNTEHWPALVHAAVGERALDDIQLFVFTQLNRRTIEATMAALGQPMEKTHTTMHKWGYTGSACIPMTLDDAWTSGKLHPGDYVVLCASGGGLAMAATLLRWVKG